MVLYFIYTLGSDDFDGISNENFDHLKFPNRQMTDPGKSSLPAVSSVPAASPDLSVPFPGEQNEKENCSQN